MPIWSLIAAREAALLAILLLLGSGPASLRRGGPTPPPGSHWLRCSGSALARASPPRSFSSPGQLDLLGSDRAGRGLGGGGRGSLRRCADHRLPRLRDLGALAVVIVAVVGPLDGVLTERHSTGPAAYYFTDGDNYVAVQDAARTVSLHAAVDAWHSHGASVRAFGNMTQFVWAFFASSAPTSTRRPWPPMSTPCGAGGDRHLRLVSDGVAVDGRPGAFASVRHFAAGRPSQRRWQRSCSEARCSSSFGSTPTRRR